MNTPDSKSLSTYPIYSGDEDVGAVFSPSNSSRSSVLRANNNDDSKPLYTLNSRPEPAPHRVVGSPSRTPKSSIPPGGMCSPARLYTEHSTIIGTPRRVVNSSPIIGKKLASGVRIPNQATTPRRQVPLNFNDTYETSPSIHSTPRDRPLVTAMPYRQQSAEKPPITIKRENQLFTMKDLSFEDLRVSTPQQNEHDLSQFECSMLSRNEYTAKLGTLNDAYKERSECPLISEIVDRDLGAQGAYNVLSVAHPSQVLLFFQSHRGSRYTRDTMQQSPEFRQHISHFIVEQGMIKDLSFNQLGNFIVQCIPGESYQIDVAFCEQINMCLGEIVMNKYGCRVVQKMIEKVDPGLVKNFVDRMHGLELNACLDKNGTHVVICLLQHHSHRVFDKFLRPFVDQNNLRILMEDKFGCRIVQKCLESLTREITFSYVPPILNELIVPLLKDADRYVSNEFANYVLQFIIEHEAFKRQRDYLIDQILLGNLLRLSQGKFSSHVVEKALGAACPVRVERMCTEIFQDYQSGNENKGTLEILLFDQFGNYVVQKLLTIAMEVSNNQRHGNPAWFSVLQGAIIRNETRLKRYSSGKKILEVVANSRRRISQQSNPMMYLPPQVAGYGYYPR